jgi:MraZ protein
MFRGNHQTRVDEKFRLKLPAEFKRRVEEFYKSPEFYITSFNGTRAVLFPMKEWESIESEVIQLPITDPDRVAFLDVTSHYGQTAEMDAQGRLLLPAVIRESATLSGDVNVMGKLTNLEVANIATFTNERMGPNGRVELTAEHQNALAGKMKALRS